MKKFDWYIIKKFLSTFFFTISLILIIVIVFDISEKIDDFLRSNVSADKIIFDYYLNFIPYFGNLFSPLFIFISVIYFTSKMAGNSEMFVGWVLKSISPTPDLSGGFLVQTRLSLLLMHLRS